MFNPARTKNRGRQKDSTERLMDGDKWWPKDWSCIALEARYRWHCWSLWSRGRHHGLRRLHERRRGDLGYASAAIWSALASRYWVATSTRRLPGSEASSISDPAAARSVLCISCNSGLDKSEDGFSDSLSCRPVLSSKSISCSSWEAFLTDLSCRCILNHFFWLSLALVARVAYCSILTM